MKKVTKGLLTTGVIALIIGACGDTVEVLVPPPPPPPPPPVIPVPPPPIPPPNRAPVAVGSIPAIAVDAGATASLDVAGYFSDADGDALTFSAGSSNDAAATVSMDGSSATITGVADGTAVVTFTARDPDGAAAAQNVSVTVGDGVAANRPPTAVNTIPAYSVDVGGAVQVNLAPYFSDADGDELTYGAESSNEDAATTSVDGAVATISGVADGMAVVTVTASDPDGASASQTISVTVGDGDSSNNPPVAQGTIPDHTVAAGGTLNVDVAGYFSDADGDELTYMASSSNADVASASNDGATVTINGVGGGRAVITVTASDGEATVAQGFNVTVEAAPVNTAPSAVGTIPSHSVGVGGTVTVDASGYFSDADGDELSYAVTSSNADVASASSDGSTVTISGVGAGSAVITVTASDGEASAVQGFGVTVEAAPSNNAPSAVGTIPDHSVGVGGTVTVSVAGYFSDADGDELSYEAASSNADVATAALEGTTVTINGVAAGSAVVTVTASDGNASAVQGFNVTVEAVPSNNAPTAVGTIPEHSVGVGASTAVDIAGYFNDADGDELTYAAASSDDAVATVSMEGTAVTVTGVADGRAVATITARDPDGAAAAQGFNVVVGRGAPANAATVTIFGLRLTEDRNTSVNPSDVSGDVTVILDVQQNDETIAVIDLMLGEQVINCRGVSASREAQAEAFGETEIECRLNTAAVMGECTGTQLAPLYANGDYQLGARLTTTEGDERETFATQSVTLNNSGFVMVTHSAGNSVLKSGVAIYGGPSDADNQNTFHACPVSYGGTEVAKLSLRALNTGPAMEDADNPDNAATSLAFTAPTGTGAARKIFNGAAADREDTFSWDLNSAFNGAVQDEGPGGREHWVFVGETMENADGLDVREAFGATNAGESDAAVGPFYFDFKAPTAGGILVGQARSLAIAIAGDLAGVSLSAGNFYLDASDGEGIGLGSHGISVGDCAANPSVNFPGRGSVNRTTVGFDALYTDVTSVAELAEDDAVRNRDSNGADCYVAELASLTDKLGNAWRSSGDPRLASSYHHTATFGVDKTAPVLEDFEPDEFDEPTKGVTAVIPVGPDNPLESEKDGVVMIEFEVQNPDLASGDAGTALLGGSATIPNEDNPRKPIIVGSVGPVDFLDPTDDDWLATLHELGDDGEKSVTIAVGDGAFPQNSATKTLNFVYDTTVPSFSGSGPTGEMIASGTSVSVNVSGVIQDMSEIEKAALTVRSNVGVPVLFCDVGDPVMSASRVPSNGRTGTGFNVADGTNEVSLDESLTIVRPTAQTLDEPLCVLLQTEDAAGNTAAYSLGTFMVDWPFGLNISTQTLPINEGTEDTPQTGTFTVALSDAPASDVTVSVTGGAAGSISVAPASLTFTTGNNSTQAQTVTVTAVQDDNAVNETATISVAASGGGYSGVRGSVAVTANDPDVTFSIDDVSIEEGATETVTVTVTRSGSATDTRNQLALSLTIEAPDADGNTLTMTLSDGSAATIMGGMVSAEIEYEIEGPEITGTDDRVYTVTVNPDGNGRGLPDDGIEITIVNDDEDDS